MSNIIKFDSVENTENGFDIIKTVGYNTVFIAEVKTEKEASDLLDELRENQVDHSEKIPVFHGDKIYIVKLNSLKSAIYSGNLCGKVLAECIESDEATYILDFLN